MSSVTLANGRRFEATVGVSVLDAALAQGVTLEHSCRTGRCGACRARVMGGQTLQLRDEPALDAAARADGWVLTCARQAVGDLALDIEDVSALDGIVAKTFPCRVDALETVAPDVMKVVLRLPPTARFVFLPGQYVDLIGTGGIRRSYSIASPATQTSRIELHLKRHEKGAMSAHWFSAARPNDLLRFRGPLGTFFLRDIAGCDIVFLATGTGYAPIQSMLAQLALLERGKPKAVHLYWGARRRADLYADPLDTLRGLQFTPVLSQADAQWHGARGHVQDALLAGGTSLDAAVVYACGSEAMIRSARDALLGAGLHPKRYFADAFVSSSPVP